MAQRMQFAVNELVAGGGGRGRVGGSHMSSIPVNHCLILSYSE